MEQYALQQRSDSMNIGNYSPVTISLNVFAIFGFLWHDVTIILPFHLIT